MKTIDFFTVIWFSYKKLYLHEITKTPHLNRWRTLGHSNGVKHVYTLRNVERTMHPEVTNFIFSVLHWAFGASLILIFLVRLKSAWQSQSIFLRSFTLPQLLFDVRTTKIFRYLSLISIYFFNVSLFYTHIFFHLV